MTNKENELDTYVFYLSIFGFFVIKRQTKKIEDGRIAFIERNAVFLRETGKASLF